LGTDADALIDTAALIEITEAS